MLPEPLPGWKLREDPKYPEYYHLRTLWSVGVRQGGGWTAWRGHEEQFDLPVEQRNDPTVFMEVCALSINKDTSC